MSVIFISSNPVIYVIYLNTDKWAYKNVWLLNTIFANKLKFCLLLFTNKILAFSLHGKPYFLFLDALKRWSFQKNCAGTWSFLYYWERWYFIFPKIWSYALDGKWRMIFLKKYMEIWKDGIFFPKTWSFFIVQKVKDGLSQEINGNMMHRPAKKNRKPDI